MTSKGIRQCTKIGRKVFSTSSRSNKPGIQAKAFLEGEGSVLSEKGQTFHTSASISQLVHKYTGKKLVVDVDPITSNITLLYEEHTFEIYDKEEREDKSRKSWWKNVFDKILKDYGGNLVSASKTFALILIVLGVKGDLTIERLLEEGLGAVREHVDHRVITMGKELYDRVRAEVETWTQHKLPKTFEEPLATTSEGKLIATPSDDEDEDDGDDGGQVAQESLSEVGDSVDSTKYVVTTTSEGKPLATPINDKNGAQVTEESLSEVGDLVDSTIAKALISLSTSFPTTDSYCVIM